MEKKRTVQYFPRGCMSQILLRMKLLSVIMLSVFYAFAGNTYSQDTKFTLELRDVTVKEVFQEIEKNSKFIMLYNENAIDVNRKIDIVVKNKTVETILNKIFRKTKNTYKIYDRQIVILENKNAVIPVKIKEKLELAPQKTITGTVNDKEGNPLPGVSIQVKGTTTGTVTDANGKFSMEIPETANFLVFSFVGMKTQEIAIGEKTTFDITMEQTDVGIGEVVAIGYGTMKKKDLSGSVASINSEQFKNIPATTVQQALVGQVSGVQVVQNGAPGAGATVRIRGISTTGNNNPLWVVDGIAVGGVYNLNPSEIETIDVLKDASATAIYGSRAANGVILVTTKRGKEGKTRVEFDSYYGFQQVWKQLDLLSGPEFATLANEAYTNSGLPLNPDWANPSSLPTTNWQDEIFQNGAVRNYNLNISGGTKKLKAALTLNYNNTEGTVISSNYERYSVRLNTDYIVNDRLRFGNSTQFSRNSQKHIGDVGKSISSQGIINDAVLYQPQRPVYNSDGSYNINTWDEIGNYTAWQIFNPVAAANFNNNTNSGQRILNSFFGELEIVDGLKFKSTIGMNVTNFTDRKFTPYYSTTPENVMNNSQSSIYWSMNETFSYDFTNMLTYSKIFGNKHNINVVVGYEAIKENYYQMNTSANDTPSNELQVLDAASSNTGKGNGYEHALLSYFGRINYIFNDKYILQFNARADGSYKFAPDKRWGYFPSGSFAWRVSNEEFMKSVKFLNDFKLRASYGASGNQSNVGDFAYMSRYTVDALGYSLGTGEQAKNPATVLSNLGNSSLLWESQVMTNVGVDVGLWNNSVSIVFDYYNKITNDMLVAIPVPSTLGAPGNSVYRNAGKVKNSGIELAITHKRSIGEFKYEINANITTINNEVLSLGNDQPIMIPIRITSGNNIYTRTEEGHSIGEFYGYVTDGIYQTTSDILPSEIDNGAQPGNRKYVDLNNDQVIDNEDRTYIGSPIPDFFYGLNLSASFKNFDFAMSLQGQYGNEIINVRKGVFTSFRNFNGAGVTNATSDLLNRWHGEGTSNTLPRVAYDIYSKDYLGSDYHVEDGSFLRCGSFQVGYTIPSSVVNWLKIDYVRIYANAQNLFTITKYSSFDPEISNYNPIFSGVDMDTYPVPRIFTIGVNLQF